MSFPKNFTWGVAAASYQIEGSPTADGKGKSVWDMFCGWDNRIWEANNGDVACDHYRRWREDLLLMRDLGVQAYRLSLSWNRLIPEGTGKTNPKGIAFYSRLFDEMLKFGIEPWVTLFHWDYPYELFCRGGWLNRDSVEWFSDYAALAAQQYGDRVRHWMTLNEPQCFISLGHSEGVNAPGVKLGWTEVLRAGHHALLAHGAGVKAIRAHAKTKPRVGYAPVGIVRYPEDESKKSDIDAARKAMFALTSKTHWNNTWWMDPVFLGHYPEDGLKVFEQHLPVIRSGDMKLIAQPLDFMGANIYHGTPATTGPDGEPVGESYKVGPDLTAMRWPLAPRSLYWGPKFLYERYGKPIAVTENGLSCTDWVSLDGQVHDPQRIDFLARYLREYRRAAADGVPVQGYFQWSIMDNFEWAEGYKQRFGLIHVDYQTQKRTPKDSYYWYKKVITGNGNGSVLDP